MKRKQHGFGIIELFLVLVVIIFLVVVVMVGGYLLKQRNNAAKNTGAANSNVVSTAKASEVILYDKNPNFTVEYPRSLTVRTSNDDPNNQYVYFSTPDFNAKNEVYDSTFTVNKGHQFYASITSLGLPATLEDLTSNLNDSINDRANIYKTKNQTFQSPKIQKTENGTSYVNFIGHSSFLSPINNSSSALFLTKKYSVTLGYTYPDRLDVQVDPAYEKEFSKFIESLTFK